MKLTILSLKGIQYDGEAAGLNVKTTSGDITVLDHHRPLVTVLTKGEAKIIKPDGGRESVAINSGFLEMGPENHLTVLAD
jgi:F-type H+-transporting ATPase subunit epsilon